MIKNFAFRKNNQKTFSKLAKIAPNYHSIPVFSVSV